ncbi:hypothetical protein A5630_23110 [Mycolicibacterium mucogenicum]|uniref:Phage portal protein n=1 Tax=Mycolicibacterium mucogenicum TaxID=56689 RepID=A0A1A3GZ64_MYCMU|nr:phage portal protein [Mycolicibacterium mucogenicum]OBJ41332.1 hypothetical protein A5630_23110 [Mycolicibacterium mucogenicum]
MTAPAQEKIDPVAARETLLGKFEEAQSALKESREYYDADRRPEAIASAVPQNLRELFAAVGYPRLYVDAVAERQSLEGFRLGKADTADDELWDWWQANDLDVEAPLGHTDALMYGRAYITISAPDPKVDLFVDPEVPIIRVEPPTALYADIDNKTKRVSQAIRAIYNADGSEIVSCTLYIPGQTIPFDKIEGEWVQGPTINTGLELVPVVPILNRTRGSDKTGTSEISPELRAVTDAAARVLGLMQAAAELMGVPLRVFFGLKPQEIGVDPVTGQVNYDAYLAKMLAFQQSEGKAYQFDAAELRNFVDALDELDRKAAAYTGLPPQYLSTSADNPASAEAIKASESRLVKKVEMKNRLFGGAWEQAMRIAYMVIKGGDLPPDYYRMESIWADPSTPTYAAKADAASKLYANGTGVIPKKRARKDMGYSEIEIEEMEQWDEEENPMGLLGTMLGTGTPGTGKQPTAGQPGANPAQPDGTVTKTGTPPTKTATK